MLNITINLRQTLYEKKAFCCYLIVKLNQQYHKVQRPDHHRISIFTNFFLEKSKKLKSHERKNLTM